MFHANNDNIYELVTQLCEKFAREDSGYVSQRLLKKLRARGYEILLGRSLTVHKNNNKVVQNYDDPVCQIMAWNLQLVVDYGLNNHAKKLNCLLEELNEKYGENDDTIKGILSFLFQLRQVPSETNNLSGDAIRKSNSMFKYYDESHFKIPKPLITSEYESTYSLLCPKRSSRTRLKNAMSYSIFDKDSHCQSVGDARSSHKDEGYYSPTSKDLELVTEIIQDKSCTIFNCLKKCSSGSLSENIGSEESIWDLALKQKENNRRTWESLGNINPAQEKYFLSEAGSTASSYAFHLRQGIYNNNCMEKKVISIEEFLKCSKLLLVGIETKCFIYKENEFELNPKVMIEGISSLMLQTICKDLTFCGNCYKGLDQMSKADVYRKKEGGSIYYEFCESIRRYLRFYMEIVFKTFSNLSLLTLHENVCKLKSQLNVLANICKVGPFFTSEQLPHGVSLINYLYENILALVDKSVLMVLLSILYPCCQVYFNTFLQPWVFDGVREDIGEFFIQVTPKYLASQGRTFWTRSYTLKGDIIPHFLTNSHLDILNCGKSINLLKICAPNSPFCKYMSKKKLYFSCCLNREQLKFIEQQANRYYLEGLEECGTELNIPNYIARTKEQEDIFLTLVSKKRAATLKRIELEKLQRIEDANKKKQAELKVLKEQYDAAVAEKTVTVLDELEREIKLKEANMQLQVLKEKLIQNEANNIIEYYDKLYQITEDKRKNAEKNIERLRKMQLNQETSEKSRKIIEKTIESNETEIRTDIKEAPEEMMEEDSEISLHLNTTTDQQGENKSTEDDSNGIFTPMPSSHSLDVINANSQSNIDVQNVRNIAEENFRIARKNKEKVLNLEMHITLNEKEQNLTKTKLFNENLGLTEAQKNKLRVMTSEFGIDITTTRNMKGESTLSTLEVNRNKNNKSDDCFTSYNNKNATLDNQNFILKNEMEQMQNCNQNVDIEELENNFEVEELKSVQMEKLTLNLNKIKPMKSPGVEPMSIGSTPMSDITSVSSPLESKLKLNIGVAQYESLPSCSLNPTAATNFSEECFEFDIPNASQKSNTSLHDTLASNLQLKPKLSKKISVDEAENFTPNCLKLFLQESIAIPLKAQLKLVESELMKYYINDLQYLTHLNSLRSYFFLLDGEFGRNITEGLFEKLYEVNTPEDLINCVTLRNLVYKALGSSSRLQDNSNCVSLKINDIPKSFNLRDPNVLDCLSLAYHVTWPLNIALPTDTIAKYDEVFKFLIKLHRVSWVLKKIFVELKFLEKEASNKQLYVMMSPEYQRLHQCRHVMTHFVQTFQCYIVGDVLQSSWEIFEKDLSEVYNIDQLYQLHTTYIKNILFMCLLNQRSSPIRQTIHKIFTLIFKFYDYLRSRQWECSEGVYSHPNFKKLDDIFINFEQMIQYLFKTCRKVARSGYQPQLNQFLDMLDINNYYNGKTASAEASASSIIETPTI